MVTIRSNPQTNVEATSDHLLVAPELLPQTVRQSWPRPDQTRRMTAITAKMVLSHSTDLTKFYITVYITHNYLLYFNPRSLAIKAHSVCFRIAPGLPGPLRGYLFFGLSLHDHVSFGLGYSLCTASFGALLVNACVFRAGFAILSSFLRLYIAIVIPRHIHLWSRGRIWCNFLKNQIWTNK